MAFIGREEQCQELKDKLDTCWPVVLLHGPKGVGKTSLVKQVTCTIADPVTFVCMDDILTLRDLLSFILVDFFTCCNQDDITLDLLKNCDCPDFSHFVSKVKSFTEKHSLITKRLIVVIDSADALLEMDPLILCGLSRLHEFLQPELKLTFLLISLLPPVHYEKPGAFLYPPLTVQLLSYSKSQAEEILTAYVHSLLEKDENLKKISGNYIRVIMSIAYDYSHDISVLKDFARTHLHKYFEPIKNGEVEGDKVVRLHKLIDAHLRQSSGNLGIRSMTQNVGMDGNVLQGCRCQQVNQLQDMPLGIKFLLISAYLASFNSKASDRRFFSKQKQAKGRKCRPTTSTSTKSKDEAPKAFPLERLVHIYMLLLDLNDYSRSNTAASELTCKAFTLVQELILLKLLVPVSAHSPILSSERKFKVAECVTRDLIEKVAKTIDFNISAHLESEMFKK